MTRGWATVLVAPGMALVTGLIGQRPAFTVDLAGTVAEAIDDFAP